MDTENSSLSINSKVLICLYQLKLSFAVLTKTHWRTLYMTGSYLCIKGLVRVFDFLPHAYIFPTESLLLQFHSLFCR